MELYFDLKEMRSYKVTGYSGKRYAFYKGKPVLVTDVSDIKKFTDHSDIFLQCTKDGKAVVNNEVPKNSKQFVKFKANLQAIVDQAEKAAEEKRQDINVNELLKLAEEDSKDFKNSEEGTEKAEETEEVKVETSKEETHKKELIKKSKPIKKKNPLECELCNQVFKSKKELEKHLEDHEDED